MPRPPTIQVRSVVKILDAAAHAGVAPQALCRAVGLDPDLIADPDNRIPFAQLVALYEHAAQLTGDDAFGLHVGERTSPTLFDVLGYVVINSPTLGAALDRLVRYHAIWTDGAIFTLTEAGAQVWLSYDYVAGVATPRRHDCEMTLAINVVFTRRLISIDWQPRVVSFQHPQPADIAEHKRIFRAPVHFNQPRNELVLDRALLALPIARADAGLYALLDRHAQELLARLPQRDDTTAQVRRLLNNALSGGDPNITAIARQLGLSARTLQRKLRTEGTAYQDVLDDMRRELAQRYLRERDMAVCEVAYLLGFSGPSAFHRAFRRWTGVTPKEFRQTKT
ncbi:MAG: AraC family transcriptional regulator [Pyrinomonadaceae bacterium]